jgi:hypothetical protein
MVFFSSLKKFISLVHPNKASNKEISKSYNKSSFSRLYNLDSFTTTLITKSPFTISLNSLVFPLY